MEQLQRLFYIIDHEQSVTWLIAIMFIVFLMVTAFLSGWIKQLRAEKKEWEGRYEIEKSSVDPLRASLENVKEKLSLANSFLQTSTSQNRRLIKDKKSLLDRLARFERKRDETGKFVKS